MVDSDVYHSYFPWQRSYPSPDENESISASDEDTIADLIEQHDQFVGSMKSRLGKLQVFGLIIVLLLSF